MNQILRNASASLLLGILILGGCQTQAAVEPPDDLPTISLEPTKPYHTIGSLPLVPSAEKYEAGNEVLVRGAFSTADIAQPVPIARTEIRKRELDGTWVIHSSAGTTNIDDGQYWMAIQAPTKSGTYELHVSILDHLYIGRSEFQVVKNEPED